MDAEPRAEKPSYGEQVIDLINQYVGPEFLADIKAATTEDLVECIERMPVGDGSMIDSQRIAMAYASALSTRFNAINTGWVA